MKINLAFSREVNSGFYLCCETTTGEVWREKGVILYFCGLGKGLRQSATGSNCMVIEKTKCARTTYDNGDGTVCKLKIKGEGTSEEFEIGVGVHQGSALSPPLFVVVVQEVTKDLRGESLCELLCTDDLVIIAESEEQVVRKFNEWKRELETRGLKVNMDKRQMMVVGRKPAVRPQRQIPMWSL